MSNDLVTIATFATPSESDVARVALESLGVRTYVTNEATLTWAWQFSNAIGGVELQVPSDDVDRAREVLEDAQTRKTLSDNDEAVSPETQKANELADRAWRAAVVGICFLPVILNVYSVWQIIQYALTDAERTSRHERLIGGAFIVNMLVFGFWSLLIGLAMK